MAQVAGRFTIVVNGTPLESLAGASIDLGDLNATPINTDQRSTHYIEEYVNSLVKGTVVLTPDAPIEDLRALRNGTITFQADNGITYTVAGAVAHNAGTWTVGKEGLAVEFFGNAAQPS